MPHTPGWSLPAKLLVETKLLRPRQPLEKAAMDVKPPYPGQPQFRPTMAAALRRLRLSSKGKPGTLQHPIEVSLARGPKLPI